MIPGPVETPSPAPGSEPDLAGVLEIVLERLFEAAPDGLVQNQEGALGVELERAKVEIAGAHDRNVSVGDERLGVENRVAVFEDPDLPPEERRIERVPRMADQCDVGPAREQEAHVDAALCRSAQDSQSPPPRREVGDGDP